jgi:SAM-dependent methyltransferase
VVDDASEDRTFEIGVEYRERHPEARVTVLRNAHNQGYGGNQKVGYAWALARGFDAVALLHGDGQYAPGELPRLLGPVERGEADAVFGSRMLEPRNALKGGMPLYKWVGNRLLTAYQNLLLGTRLSEFHSGYRVYSTGALRRIQFRMNTNDFHFDTEIIIQLLNAGQRIVELPIPTYYGDEICRVNGLGYAGNVVHATTRNLLHRSGLLYQRRYDPLADDNLHYESKLGYPSSHSWAVAAVPAGSRVLDLGSGPGEVARELVAKGCTVTLVDRHPPTDLGPGVRAVRQDLDEPLQVNPDDHDVILMLDILEHLRSPEAFLEQLRARLGHEPRRVVVSLPNVAFVVVRIMLLLGQFNYGKAGILDRTHTRLFTFRSARHLLRDGGYRLVRVRGVPAPFPKVLGNGVLGRLAVGVNLLLIRLSRSLFAYQIFLEADSTPDVDFLVRDAEGASRGDERA